MVVATAQKMKYSNKYFFNKCDQIFNGKLHFLCSASISSSLVKIDESSLNSLIPIMKVFNCFTINGISSILDSRLLTFK